MSTINRNITSSSDSEMKFINPNMRCNFAPIDNWLCKTKISSNAKMLYGRLRQFADENGVAYPKMDTLAKACGLQKRTAERALKVLKDHKLIYTVKSRMRKTNSYLFLWHPWMEEAVDPKVVEAIEGDKYINGKINTTNMSSTQKTHTTNVSYVHTTNMSYLYNRRKEHIEKNMYVGTHTHSGNNVFLENPAKRSSTNLDEYNPPVHNENFIVDNQKLDDCIIDSMITPESGSSEAEKKKKDKALKSKKPYKTKLPQNIELSTEWINEALRLGIHPTWVEDIFDEFKDYWVNEASGKEALHANWFRVWSNRCRSQLSWTTKNPHSTNQKTLPLSELIPVTINESDQEIKEIREKILEILGAATYQSWFQNAVILKQADRLTIETNRSLFRDTIERQYRAKIEEHLGITVQVCLNTGAGE